VPVSLPAAFRLLLGVPPWDSPLVSSTVRLAAEAVRRGELVVSISSKSSSGSAFLVDLLRKGELSVEVF
jgi:hypothetical protein